MTGRSYYLTTLADWLRHAARFANSHFIVLGPDQDCAEEGSSSCPPATSGAPNPDAKILALIEADEGVHLSLEDEAAFEPLPHPLTHKPISPEAQPMLAQHGVAPGATTFDAAEVAARIHPLLRYRVF